MNKLTGAFYFKRTTCGNLMGEFTNDQSNEVRVETAFPLNKTGESHDFGGTYQTTWFDTHSHEAELEIQKIGKKYKIIWKQQNGQIVYSGEGFLVDNILIGYYIML